MRKNLFNLTLLVILLLIPVMAVTQIQHPDDGFVFDVIVKTNDKETKDDPEVRDHSDEREPV